MTWSPRKQWSRIYAGNEPLPPLNPLVPFALVVVWIGVYAVRSFCAQYASAQSASELYDREAFGAGPRVEFLERGVLWLFAGAIACGLAILFRWVRGRRMWGNVPLGFGVGACVLSYVSTCFFGFSRDGEINSASFDLSFVSPVVFGLLVLFLSYMLLQFVEVRLRSDRRSVLALAAIPMIVLISTWRAFAVFRCFPETLEPSDLVIEDNSLTMKDVRYHAGWRVLPARSGVFLYAEHEGRPVVAVDARSVKGTLRAGEFAYLDEDFTELDPGARDPGVKYEWIYDHVPDAVISLGADASAARLHEFTRDLRNRKPAARDVSILSWHTSYPARFQGFEWDKLGMDEPAVIFFQLDAERPAWEVHVRHVGGEVLLQVADKPWPAWEVLSWEARKAEKTDERGHANGEFNVEMLPSLRLRIDPDVSMQEFVDAVIQLRAWTFGGWALELVIDDWVPSVEGSEAR